MRGWEEGDEEEEEKEGEDLDEEVSIFMKSDENGGLVGGNEDDCLDNVEVLWLFFVLLLVEGGGDSRISFLEFDWKGGAGCFLFKFLMDFGME